MGDVLKVPGRRERLLVFWFQSWEENQATAGRPG